MNTIKIISEAYSEAYWKFGVSIGKSELQKIIRKSIHESQAWYKVKEHTAEEIEELGEVLIKDSYGEIDLAKLVSRDGLWIWEVKNPNTDIDLDDIFSFRSIELK